LHHLRHVRFGEPCSSSEWRFVTDLAARFAGNVAVVTGAANGIGRAAVLRMVAEGARVVAADLNADAAARLERDVADRGGSDALRCVVCDVSVESSVEALVQEALQAFGGLDLLFNNAGTSTPPTPVEDLAAADWDRLLRINLDSVFFGIKHATPLLKRNPNGGSIVNTASLAALSGEAGPLSYSASKAAVVNLTMTTAVQLAPHRIRVNVVSPGWILTSLVMGLRGSAEELIPVMERAQPWPEHGRPEDVAAAALFLLSEDARFITGHNLVVDGGMTAAGPSFFSRVAQLKAELAAEGNNTDKPA
jgi:NAD(P)-dependent dehydrogenase (short-subunit alcohol dehydrogenase family)